MTSESVAAISQPAGPRSVFISHKHEDAEIAQLLADCLQSLAGPKIEIFLTSSLDYDGVKFGAPLKEQIAQQLSQTELFLLLYTGGRKDYSWCTYEAGLATDTTRPDAKKHIVISLVDDAPSMFDGTRFVKAMKTGEIEGFLREFCFDAKTFPGEGGPLLEATPALEEAAVTRAEALTKTFKATSLGDSQEIPRWPTVALHIGKKALDDFVEGVRKDKGAFASDGETRSKTMQRFLETALVITSEKQGTEALGFNWTNEAVALQRIRENWLDLRREIERQNGPEVVDNTPWDIVIAQEVYNICRSIVSRPDWSPFLDLETQTKWLYPFISTSFLNRDGSREFRVRIVPLLSPSEIVSP